MNTNQEKILKLIRDKDISQMSLRKIAEEAGIENPDKNAQTVRYYIKKLKNKDLLYFDPQQRRHMVSRLKAFTTDGIFNIPIVGSANCGPASELAVEDIQGYLKVSQKIMGRNKPEGLIAVKAIGDSLNMANVAGNNIEDGDYVIVDCKRQPRNGDYILSVIDGAANFKRFFKDKEEIRLVSESTLSLPPIVLHEEDVNTLGYMINGVVIKVIKK